MRISRNCVSLVKEFEGYHRELSNGNCKAYLCPANVWTIGFGTTVYPNGTTVKSGDIATREQAEAYLEDDLSNFSSGVVSRVNVKLSQSQFDALVSFSYNVGLGAFGNSTLLRKLNRGDYQGAANEFGKWVYGGNRVLAGLVRRRKAEKNLFLAEDSAIVNRASYGDSNNTVKLLQKMLNVWLSTYEKDILEVDGIYGTGTLNAVKDFQKNNQLPQESFVDNKCWSFIEKFYNDKTQPPGNPSTPVEKNIIKLNDSGEDVETFQKMLNSWLKKFNKKLLVVDGDYGPATDEAARDFQKNNKQELQSYITSECWKLVENFWKKHGDVSAPQPAPGLDDRIKVYNKHSNIKLSDNFSSSEFKCKCGGHCSSTKISGKVVKLLEKLRAKLGKPIYITSAYRCKVHNRNVGGVSNSRHLVGDAADIVVAGVSPDQVGKAAEELGFDGIGVYRSQGFTHVDCRGYRARWFG